MGTAAGHVVVVGGGISGLAAAHALSLTRPAPQVTVLEAAPWLGGKLALQDTGGVRYDGGAEAVLTRRPEAVDLIEAVGLGGDLVHPAREGTSILVEGTLRPLPRHQLMGIPSDLRELAASGVLSLGGLLRVPLDRVLPATPVDDDITIGELVGSRLGRQVVDRLVEPLLGGVYAGHADQLSLGATLPALLSAMRGERSLLAAVAGARPSTATPSGPVFASVRGGLGRLPDAVATASGAEVRLDSPVDTIRRTGTGWEVVTGGQRLSADAVVLALPAAGLAQLLRPHAPAAAELVAGIEYASVALVTFVFPGSAVTDTPPGSGFLVPPAEERVVKAVTYASAKWAWLSEDHPERVVVRASVGRHLDRRDLARDDDDLAWAVLGEVEAVSGLRDAPAAHSVVRWDDALPQYAVGHPGRVARVRAALDELPGLAACGAALDGVGIPACIASGQAAAATVVAQLPARSQ